jgi:glycosyltransferase involved in cell wall biosynthesis
MTEPLRVLAVATYPLLAAATRYRLLQYVPLLAEEGVQVDVRTFLSDRVFTGLYDRRRILQTIGGVVAGVGRRISDAFHLGHYDLIFVQREAALIGPAVFEWLAQRSLPMVLDLDDSTYIERPSEVFGIVAKLLKFHGKTARMIPWSDHVVCGNPTIAAYVAKRGIPVSILPTIVDVNVFTPRAESSEDDPLVIGWMGTHSTYAYLRSLIPVFQRLAKTHRFKLRIIGSGREEAIDGVEAEFAAWRLDREVADLQAFDVAVYPIIVDEWAEGKSGFKSIQYLSCGLPFVASPVGVVSQIGVPEETHLEARTDDEWERALSRLLTDAALRRRLRDAGRHYAVERYSTRDSAAQLAGIFREVVKNKKAAR